MDSFSSGDHIAGKHVHTDKKHVILRNHNRSAAFGTVRRRLLGLKPVSLRASSFNLYYESKILVQAVFCFKKIIIV